MATGTQVLSMLIPTGGWVISGDDFDSIQFLEAEPITKAKFQAGFAKYDSWKAEEIAAEEAAAAQKATTRAAILNRLGLTAEEVAILLG
jgi:hypothetical protein